MGKRWTRQYLIAEVRRHNLVPADEQDTLPAPLTLEGLLFILERLGLVESEPEPENVRAKLVDIRR